MKNTGGDRWPREAAGDDGLPGWASRHLAEAAQQFGADGSDASAASAASAATATSPSAPVRHRYPRRRESSRLRGWALATAAVAAATGTVPLALSTLAREEPPMPRVGTFPVAAPADLGVGAADRVPGGSGPSAPGPDLAATLPPLVAPDTPVVVPTAQGRPLPPSTRRVEARVGTSLEGSRPPRAAPTTTTTTTTTSPSPAPESPDPDDDEGGESPRESPGSETPTPREGPTTTTTTSTSPRPVAERQSSDDDDDRSDRGTSLVDSAVGTVRGVGGGLLG